MNVLRLWMSASFGRTGTSVSGYLCVSERGEWIPVICSAIEADGQTLFRNMGKNIIYLPTVYENKRMRPAGRHFLFG